MKRRRIGESELEVSALALGTMNFGYDWHGIGAVEESVARDLVDSALDKGVNFIDTADVYGHGAAETMLGKIIKGRRDQFVIASKVCGRMDPDDPSSGGLSKEHIAEGLDASLMRLGTDYLDLYMPHAPDSGTELEESLEAFDRAVQAGKIRVLGCSNFDPDYLKRSLDWAEENNKPRFEFNQVQISLAAPWALSEHKNTSLLAWSPLAGGLLTGKYADPKKPRPHGRRHYPKDGFPNVSEARLAPLLALLSKISELENLSPAQAAIGWLLGKSEISSVILGARNREQLNETLESRPLSERSMVLLDKAVQVLVKA
ncbi:MAG: aldo/keto reductase [Elusimicrobia bacterium]|nr:MAG: aldo/keto reductase [Elusimicrobiota bacterium]